MITWHYVPVHYIFDELKKIVPRHYAEIAEDDEPVNIDWQLYELASINKQAMAVTARDDGKLVGYIVFTITKNLRHKHITEAVSSGWFIEPEYRGTLGMEIVDKAGEYLKANGVHLTKFILGGTAGKLLARKGYTTKHQVWEIRNE